ncbi:MAG: PilZ domain-containing protein [Candidatus Eremiobacteraeota bacterium]|nr:PilZ domain-containing protein [Candidatus Eremiobacteraeota bacterium]
MFFFWKKKKVREPRSLVRPAANANQKRSTFRMPVEFDVFYTLNGRRGRRSARANDLSAGGLRLSCDEDFLKESVLTLEFELPADFLANMTVEKEVYEQSPFGLRPETIRSTPPGFAPMTIDAKVLAPFFEMAQRKFAYGMAFVDIDRKTEDEIQRFIHLWQLNYLRTRRGDLG